MTPEAVKISVHPRTRGEHDDDGVVALLPGGSSPHPRGTYHGIIGSGHFHRFIPAPAGNIYGLLLIQNDRTVHPRTRGEHTGRNIWGITGTGSSPHPRGTLIYPSGLALDYRFIPAPAGNIAPRTPATIALLVHPRTRGEHPARHVQSHIHYGSSPHPRGT